MKRLRPSELIASMRRWVQFALFRDGWFSARQLVPNFFTLLSICAGLLAIRWAIEREFEWSIAAIVIAAILDALDGRMARILHAQSKFGAEFDSLADFVSFGVAPAILLFNWGLFRLDGAGWVAVTALALACGVRLARFNATVERERLAWEEDYLTGVPAPAGAIIVMLPLYLDGLRSFTDPALPGLTQPVWAPWAVLVYTVSVALLMVSTIPTYAGKATGDRIARNYPMAFLVVLAALTWLLLRYPYATLATGTAVYFGLMPLGVRRFLRLTKLVTDDEELGATYSRNAGE